MEIKSEATILSTCLKGSCKFNSPSLYYLFQSILYTKSKKKKKVSTEGTLTMWSMWAWKIQRKGVFGLSLFLLKLKTL